MALGDNSDQSTQSVDIVYGVPIMRTPGLKKTHTDDNKVCSCTFSHIMLFFISTCSHELSFFLNT